MNSALLNNFVYRTFPKMLVNLATIAVYLHGVALSINVEYILEIKIDYKEASNPWIQSSVNIVIFRAFFHPFILFIQAGMFLLWLHCLRSFGKVDDLTNFREYVFESKRLNLHAGNQEIMGQIFG
jgi:hypothetical protein